MSLQTHEYAKYLETKDFSNKNYGIRVTLFEQGMAKAVIHYKKRKFIKGSMFLFFDASRSESVIDTYECLEYLRMDKVARRWFRSVLKPCYGKYLLPDGRISVELAMIDEQEQWFQFHCYAKDVDMSLFRREDVLTDSRYQNRDITFHTDDDDLSKLDFKKENPLQPLPPLAIHCDYQLLFELLQEVCPDFYQRLSKYGYDTIESIKFICRFGKEDKVGESYHCGYVRVVVDYPKLAPYYQLPEISDDE